MAHQLRQILTQKGYQLYLDSPTNQQFIVLENAQIRALEKHVRFDFWEPLDDTHSVVRFATSWSTTAEDLSALEALL